MLTERESRLMDIGLVFGMLVMDTIILTGILGYYLMNLI